MKQRPVVILTVRFVAQNMAWALAVFASFGAFGSFADARPDFTKLHLIAGCRIHTTTGAFVRQFSGHFCQFLPDGRVVSADAERLVMLKPDRSEVWRRPGHYHHQLNWSEDKKHLLVLSSDFRKIDEVVVRVDVFRKIDLEGKVVAEIDAQKIFDQLKIKKSRVKFNWDSSANEKTDEEISHFNSFYEIPRQTVESKFKSLRAGNFIVNSIELGAFILNSDLTKALGRIDFQTSIGQSTHDVQVTAAGEVLFLNNNRVRNEAREGPRSSIEKLNPATRKTTFLFMSNPPEMFFTAFSGGVQELPGEVLLISHMTNAFYFLEAKTQKVLASGNLLGRSGVNELRRVQQIRAEDLTTFLAKWASTD